MIGDGALNYAPEIIAEVLEEPKKLEISSHLEPGSSLNGLVEELKNRRKPVEDVLLVGHEPDLSRWISILVTGKPGLALELKPVRVNAVSPAFIDTPLWGTMDNAERQTLLQRVAASYPAGRVGRPEDVAQQLLLFAANTFATGTVVTLDGGASIA